MESTAVVSVWRRGRPPHGIGLVKQFLSQRKTAAARSRRSNLTFRHTRGQHRRFTVFTGVTEQLSTKPTRHAPAVWDSQRNGEKPFNHFQLDDLIFSFKDGRRRHRDCESISRNYLFFPLSLSLVQFGGWHKRNGNHSKAISLWWLICICCCGMSDGEREREKKKSTQSPEPKSDAERKEYYYYDYYNE